MPSIVNYLVLLMLVMYTVLLVIDACIPSRRVRLKFEALLLLVALGVLHFGTGFPTSSGRIAFGGSSLLTMIGFMYLCVIAGMVARYVFYLKGKIDWLALLKPLCVSPLVLLPLIGSLQDRAPIQAIQGVSLAMLAFQNGFFWTIVLDRVKPRV